MGVVSPKRGGASIAAQVVRPNHGPSGKACPWGVSGLVLPREIAFRILPPRWLSVCPPIRALTKKSSVIGKPVRGGLRRVNWLAQIRGKPEWLAQPVFSHVLPTEEWSPCSFGGCRKLTAAVESSLLNKAVVSSSFTLHVSPNRNVDVAGTARRVSGANGTSLAFDKGCTGGIGAC